MWKAILKFFGLISLSEYNSLEKKLNEATKLNKDLTVTIAEVNGLFEKPNIIPPIEFKDFEKEQILKGVPKSDIWTFYWKQYYSHYYMSYDLRTLSMYPKALTSLMHAITNFDWDEQEKYMNKVGWKWSGNSFTPTKSDLIDTVISLAASAVRTEKIDFDSSGCSSGGFTISFKKVGDDYETTIDFEKQY